jgi:hypothetical protein
MLLSKVMEALGYAPTIAFTPGVNKELDKQPSRRYDVIIHPRDEKMFEFQAGNRWKSYLGRKN